MAAHHLAAASIAAAMEHDSTARAKNEAIRAALDDLIAAADNLARVAGVDYLSVDLGTSDEIYAAVDHADGWRTTINPGSTHGKPFGVARTYRGDINVSVFGPYLQPEPTITPPVDANPIVIRPRGIEV